MAVDTISGVDLKYIADNLLTPDDFNLGINFEVEVDPNEYLFSSDEDILQQITEDLEIPMSLDGDQLNNFNFGDDKLDPFSVFNDNVHDGLGGVKEEPPSPLPSPSSPNGSNSSTEMCWSSNEKESKTNLLETPPITPQSSLDGSPPSTPTNQELTNNVCLANGLPSVLSTNSSIPLLITLNNNNNNTSSTTLVNNHINTIKSSHPRNIAGQSNVITQTSENIQQNNSINSLENGSISGAQASQVLVLTPGDYSSLATTTVKLESTPVVSANGKTKVTAIKPLPTVLGGTNNNGIMPTLKPLVSMPTSNVKQELDINALKRQQRMIKNRESACLSRKKKKEYMTSLEGQVKELAVANARLQQENAQLRLLTSRLEKENAELRKRSNFSAIKKTTAVFTILFMLSLNLAPLGNIFLSSRMSLANSDAPGFIHHRSRNILWSDSNNSSPLSTDNLTGQNSETFSGDELGSFRNSSSQFKTNCPIYINKTESLRLDSDLRGWVFHSEQELTNKLQQFQLEEERRKSLPPIPRLRSLIINKPEVEEANKNFRKNSDVYGTNDLQIFNTLTRTYDSFFEAIHRRDDTFYVVSFNSDHLLLPALAHNKTRRPLMALVLPAVSSLNESNPPEKDHVAMMQIDCEVINTRLVHIKESLVPPNFQHSQKNVSNQTSSSSSFASSQEKKEKTGDNIVKSAKSKKVRKKMISGNETKV